MPQSARVVPEVLWNRSKIFADDKTLVLHTFKRNGREKRRERQTDISTFGCGHAMRNEKEALQPEHMIEPNRAGVTHRCLQ